MKNILSFTALALGLAGSASALNNTGSIWGGVGCTTNPNQNADYALSYCVGSINSATTVANIGKIQIDPAKTIAFLGTNSGTVSGVVTPTANLFLGNRLVGTQTISLTTAGNLVAFPASRPYFDGVTVSISTPGLLGTSQSAVISIIQNAR